MTTRIFTIAHIPKELHQAWLQHLRNFDVAHPGCHFEVMSDAPDLTLAQAVELVRVNPELTFTQIFERVRTRRLDELSREELQALFLAEKVVPAKGDDG